MTTEAVKLTKKDWVITGTFLVAVFVILPLLVYLFASWRSAHNAQVAQERLVPIVKELLPQAQTVLESARTETHNFYLKKVVVNGRDSGQVVPLSLLEFINYKESGWVNPYLELVKKLPSSISTYQKTTYAANQACNALSAATKSTTVSSQAYDCSFYVEGDSASMNIFNNRLSLIDNPDPNMGPDPELVAELVNSKEENPVSLEYRKGSRSINGTMLISREPIMLWGFHFNIKDSGGY